MRILVVSQMYWPENFRINDLVSGLVQRGHEVVVLTGLPNYPAGRLFEGYGWRGPWRERHAGATVVRVPLIPRGAGGAFRLVLNYLSFAFVASILGPMRCRGRFDAIFVHEPSPVTVGLPAVVLKWLKRAPIYFWILDLWPESLHAVGAIRSRFVLSMVGHLVRYIYHHCDFILMQSEAFRPSIESFGVEPSRLRYFPNWAEPLFKPMVVDPKSFSGPTLPHGFKVMYAGNIGAAQDFSTVLDAATQLRDRKDIHWLIVGDGRMAEWARGQVRTRELSATVHLWGSYPLDRMPEFLGAADVMLVSLRAAPIFALTVPAKVQAYMACGRPIVAMLDGEGSRIVRDAGAGLTCAAGDSRALADRVLEMAAMDPNERTALGNAGLAYCRRHFDRETLFQRLDGWLAADTSHVPITNLG